MLAPESLIVLGANEAMARALGTSINELQGRSVLQWIDISHRTDFVRAVRLAGRHPLPQSVPFLWIGRDGQSPRILWTNAWTFGLSSQTEAIGLSAREREDFDAASLQSSAIPPAIKTVG